jgi:hypothetical protein
MQTAQQAWESVNQPGSLHEVGQYSSVGLQQRRAIAAFPKGARDRARELLLSHLTLEQRETLERNKWFVVRGGKSGKLYRIRDQGSMVANIEELIVEPQRVMLIDEVRQASHRLCAHCDLFKYPLGDQLLAQKLMLEIEEEAFLKIANRHAA